MSGAPVSDPARIKQSLWRTLVSWPSCGYLKVMQKLDSRAPIAEGKMRGGAFVEKKAALACAAPS